MVKNANFIGMQPWESQLIGSLCRFHKDEKLLDLKNEKKIPYSKRDELRDVFIGLVALLQIADSLDRGHKGFLKLKSAKISRSEIQIRFKSQYNADLEHLRFEQKKNVFESWFGLSIELKK
jgi:exopolyphosphatase/pppGpp-phosphohydrolase